MSKGISRQQKHILKSLLRFRDGRTPKQIAKIAKVSDTNIRRSLISLEKRGYLIRSNEEDSQGHKRLVLPCAEWHHHASINWQDKSKASSAVSNLFMTSLDYGRWREDLVARHPELQQWIEANPKEYWKERSQGVLVDLSRKLNELAEELDVPIDPELHPEFDWKTATEKAKALRPDWNPIWHKWYDEAEEKANLPRPIRAIRQEWGANRKLRIEQENARILSENIKEGMKYGKKRQGYYQRQDAERRRQEASKV